MVIAVKHVELGAANHYGATTLRFGGNGVVTITFRNSATDLVDARNGCASCQDMVEDRRATKLHQHFSRQACRCHARLNDHRLCHSAALAL